MVIRNGRVLDGLGNPWVYADIAIRNGRIVADGHVDGRGQREIDATGRYVSPGWIDLMDQSGEVLRATASPRTSCCRESPAPSRAKAARRCRPSRSTTISTSWRRKGISLNFGTYYSSAQARVAVMGDGAGAPDAAQLRR